MGWWSDKFNRPLKDPVLLSYSIEELAYEYYLSLERNRAEQERLEEEGDKIEEAKDKAEQDWADQMEKEEAEAKAKIAKDPLKDPKNIEWMEQEIQKNKELYGEEFGEDINLDLEGK